ncbi:DNA alkylation repair protein [Lujinxingia vulgaris]|uniref:DNA alkylation repair protein n=1 Tax=Lujinxingia vulgaris TaxID=2600176 RepID=A0A5C6XGN2_9DELT|nr:DNA alkylation repair protein [Lujinxingia vulgaris]TXD37278.1 DNA alkylation repair protein [Lujinxingia vulgaris]
MTFNPSPIAHRVSQHLQALADPNKAEKMAAYMKTSMPFYGVQAGPRDQIVKAIAPNIHLATHDDYVALIETLWALPHREEKYIAIRLARRFKPFISLASLPLYERLIRDGEWWDFTDEIATHLVGTVLKKSPDQTWPTLDRWLLNPNLWIRRAALLAQNRLKSHTDPQKLFAYCLHLADEEDFFIRKAIGWALREYARTNPDAVRTFLTQHHDTLSPLSIREASKHLER